MSKKARMLLLDFIFELANAYFTHGATFLETGNYHDAVARNYGLMKYENISRYQDYSSG